MAKNKREIECEVVPFLGRNNLFPMGTTWPYIYFLGLYDSFANVANQPANQPANHPANHL